MEARKRELIAGLYGLLEGFAAERDKACEVMNGNDLCHGIACKECPLWCDGAMKGTMEAIDDLTGPIDEKESNDDSEKR